MAPISRTWATLCFFCILCSAPSIAYMTFRSRIPNGFEIPHPCIPGRKWEGVGHLDPFGGGARNPFGIDFENVGNFQWTEQLCLRDSDGDGFTNGEELGDPDCEWSVGDTPKRISGITHPGICDPLENEICAGRSTFVSCDNITPDDQLQCDNLNRTGVFSRDYRIPKTTIPVRGTTYVCYTFNAPSDEDLYLIGMEPLIDNENIMHHIVAYGCPESTPIFNEPTECIMGSLCADIIGVWAVGFPGLCLPNNVGFLFGTRGYKKIQFEFHWDNTQLLANQMDASGMRMHFEQPRPGIITAGVMLMGSILLRIPSAQSRYEEHGGCDSDCTSQIWNGSLNLFGVVNHMHYIGIEQRTSIWRDGNRLLDLAHDRQASFDNPIYHRFDNPVIMRPGDAVRTTCVYDSSTRPRTTYYGEGTTDEMCFFFAFYYPKENSITNYCNEMGPLSQCQRNARAPIGNCDWNHFIEGIASQSLPIAQELRENCALGGACLPECMRVVEALKRHPCMQEDMLLFITTRMRNRIEGVRFLARYGTCANYKVCPVPDHGQRSAWASGGVTMTAVTVAMFILKVLA